MHPQLAADNLFLLVLPEVSVHLTVMRIFTLYSLFPQAAQNMQFQRELASLRIVGLRDLRSYSHLVQHREGRLSLLFVKWIILKAIIACLGLLLLAFLALASTLGKAVRHLTIT